MAFKFFLQVFAFLPYQVGYNAIFLLGGQEFVAASHFEGLLTTLCGYCVVGIFLVVLHTLAALLGFQRSQRILGLGYVIVKVKKYILKKKKDRKKIILFNFSTNFFISGIFTQCC